MGKLFKDKTSRYNKRGVDLKITIDTKLDSTDDIRKAISFLQEFLDDSVPTSISNQTFKKRSTPDDSTLDLADAISEKKQSGSKKTDSKPKDGDL